MLNPKAFELLYAGTVMEPTQATPCKAKAPVQAEKRLGQVWSYNHFTSLNLEDIR